MREGDVTMEAEAGVTHSEGGGRAVSLGRQAASGCSEKQDSPVFPRASSEERNCSLARARGRGLLTSRL